MASTFILKRKCFAEWNEQAKAALRKGKELGYTGKDLRNYVSLNSGATTAGAGLGNRLGGPTVISGSTSAGTTGGNMVSLTGHTNSNYGNTYKSGADKAFQGVTTQQNTIMNREATRAANRAANKANSAAVAEAAKRARSQGFNAGLSKGTAQGFKSGANSVGVWGGIKNTWNRPGIAGKAGLIAGGTALAGTAYLAGKQLFGKKKD